MRFETSPIVFCRMIVAGLEISDIRQTLFVDTCATYCLSSIMRPFLDAFPRPYEIMVVTASLLLPELSQMLDVVLDHVDVRMSTNTE